MAFKQYNEAPVVENLTGEEKVYINDGNSFKQASINDIVAQGSKKNDYLTIKKIKDYLFETYYGVIDYGNAYAYFASQADPIDMGACSAVRNGNWYGRNLDWTYDNNAEFIVHTPHVAGRYASLAVAGGIPGLTNDVVTSEEYNALYKIVPFRLYDGINEYGVIINMNVVPTDNGINVSIPTEQEEVTISAQMLVRYVLDYFKTASEAVDYIQKHMKIYFSNSLHEHSYELHFMVADEEKTYLVEFANNAAVVVDMSDDADSNIAGKAYMTNFYLNDITLNDDGTVYTPETQTADYNAKDTNGITDCGAGLERYNYIVDAYDSANTKDGMRAMMNGLKYTRTYSTAPDAADPVWLTEYVGVQGLTVISDPEDFDAVVQYAGGMFNDRSRVDGLTWQTVHSAVYDIENRALNIIVQEDGEELEFALDGFERKDNPEPVVLPPEVENAVATHGMGWTVSAVGEVVVEETVYTSDTSGRICTTGLDIETPCVTYSNPGQMLCVCNGIECDVEVGYGHNDEYDENFYSMNITHNGEQVLYLWQLEDNFYVINGNTPQPNQTVDFVIYSVDNDVHKIAEKYMPEKVSNAIETHGMGWTESSETAGFDITWDGDTTGLESFVDQAYKVASSVEGIDAESVIGVTMVYAGYSSEVTADKVTPSGDNVLMISDEDIGGAVIVVLEDSTLMDMPITKGVWFFKSLTDETNYVSRLYKEASTEEVVHKIDQKYIPSGGSGGGAMIVTFADNPDDEFHPMANKTPQEAMAALMSMPVLGVIDIEGDKMPLGQAYFSGTVISFLVAGVDVDTGRILYYINGDVSDNVWTLTGA